MGPNGLPNVEYSGVELQNVSNDSLIKKGSIQGSAQV